MLENLIPPPVWTCWALICATIFFEVSAVLYVRHCPKLQSCAISGKNNDANLRKRQKNVAQAITYAIQKKTN